MFKAHPVEGRKPVRPAAVQQAVNLLAEYMDAEKKIDAFNVDSTLLSHKLRENQRNTAALVRRQEEITRTLAPRFAEVRCVAWRGERLGVVKVVRHEPDQPFLTIDVLHEPSALAPVEIEPRMFDGDQITDAAFDAAYGEVFGDGADTIEFPGPVSASLAVIDQEAS